MLPDTPIPSSSVRFLVAGLSALGCTTAQTAERVGLSTEALGPHGSLSLSQAFSLVELAIAVGGLAFGVRAGFAIPMGELGLVDHLCGAAPTGKDALLDLARYFRLVATGVSLDVEGATVQLNLPDLPPRHQRVFSEMTFAIIDQRLSARSTAPLAPLKVSFTHPEPADPQPVRKRWPQARFSAAANQMVCDPQRLAQPLRSQDPSLRALLDRYAAEEIARLPARETLADRIEQLIVAALPGDVPTASDAARSLGMSGRSLRRSLAKENLQYSGVRDRCLQRLAQEALRDEERTIGEVAWLLGYSEPSAFHRAFRRWTGTTPERYRAAGRLGH